MKLTVLIYLSLGMISIIFSRVGSSSSVSSSDEIVILNKWKMIVKESRTLFDKIMEIFSLPMTMKRAIKANVTSGCSSDLEKLFQGLKKMDLWAFQMLDSSGKVSSGFLRGVRGSNGEYDACLGIDSIVKGQYCPVYVTPPLPSPSSRRITRRSTILNISSLANNGSILELFQKELYSFYRFPLRFGLCVPSSCKAADLRTIIQIISEKLAIKAEIPYCTVNAEIEVQMEDALLLLLLGVIALASIVSTLLLATQLPLKGSVRRIAECFSIALNFEKLFTLNDSSRDSRLAFLNGFKCVSMIWLILSHSYGLIPFMGTSGLSNIDDMMEQPGFQVFANAFVSVDNFFVVSGLLVGYATLTSLYKTNGSINLFRLILRRIQRLGPSLWIVVCLTLLTKFSASGPLFPEEMGREITRCNATWPSTVFFLSSWLEYDQMCLVQTWYVSADLHLFVAGVALSILYYRKPVMCRWIAGTLVSGSTLAIAVSTLAYNLHPSIIFEAQDEKFMKLGVKLTHFRAYCHLAPYLTGLFLGFLFVEKKRLNLSVMVRSCFWLLSLLVYGLVLYIPGEWHKGHFPPLWIGALYQSLHKTAWGLAVAWTLLASYYGYGGWMTSAFNWKIFVPLSRLIYPMYLLNMPVIWLRNSTRRVNLYYGHVDILFEFCGVFLVTLTLSALLFILVEAPFTSLFDVRGPTTSSKANSKFSKD